MNQISAILVIKGNPPHAIEAIDSVKAFVKEIIVADIGIDQDLKKKLASYKTIRIVQIDEKVPYVEVIREKLKMYAKEEYILFLDPDEILTTDLKNELQSKLTQYDYFSIPRKNIIFGKWIRHSRWWPDEQIRLFKKDSVVWPHEIHKQPRVSGKGFQIKAEESYAICHFNYESIDEYLTKAMRYAKSEATLFHERKQLLHLPDTMKKGISEFISRFFANDGYKDGIHGFILALFQLFYPFLVYFYYLELLKFNFKSSEKTLLQETSNFLGKLYKESLFWKAKKDSVTLKEKMVEKIID
ncbi:hypothetical protein A2334_04160 [Candidatus Roizmanbacteria bacterium RIFOXYB2_FULL_38_10]|uniref:Glycosyltransferase 2-like domain-containing protein n=1 Tax=Candidatus Roizmanbacteria bacterium RIFOXYD1_FULL_38_12 TaxID=1802093 RepID=A0A1F7KZC8_9BACT|nr:MAG: hypothetical protein A3K47_00270 [Candidatus Roizmanbacteria bacterium RIFOXYA2_FULL_38_14]OGK63236.1 MAG: hypothetical protein A3K27_00270 [Candidatus Roizmanbacteria bacterium RIFOXYA1_FULL_37_12]OGK65082.1 MAG: hypothetical protein A3K38_00270 [Candidatus Roizmanbacteria bacterium RIFOXYB1_FULL_40_23]OGK68636.1 MAG: hypothetical protein A2334_04160 [Candidatus Roizmanbacteria bacterium RIFOXYB2_FULL_38_10]OGK69486.1 MAG: hypothetical protein A3K21_00270 [Candidatus Roizmanbacteria ba